MDARQTYRQIGRAHSRFHFRANESWQISLLYTVENPGRNASWQRADTQGEVSVGEYLEFPGMQNGTWMNREVQGWSLNPGRYVGVARPNKIEYVESPRS